MFRNYFGCFSGIRIKDEFFVNGCPKSGKNSDCLSGSSKIRKNDKLVVIGDINHNKSCLQ